MTSPIGTHPRRTVWNLETLFLGIVGAAMIWQRDVSHHLTIVQETIVLVIFLGGLMGITRIPFPSTFAGRPIPLWAYPLISGGISGFMDSFLVLLLVGAARLDGSKEDQFAFKAYNMIAALIGGLTLYFGEVYMLPLALKYGMREWYSMLPIVPPVLVFLLLLAFLANRLQVRVLGMKTMDGNGNGHTKKAHADWFDYVEFSIAIVVLLVTHNALLCLGVLLLYSFVTGQGEDLIDVMKTETEVGVMLLLVFAAFVAGPIEPYMATYFPGWWAFIPSTINGVLTGAIYPASGDVWFDAHILSTAVLLTPISSLVGVMLFKTASEWWRYCKMAVPLAIVWFVLCGAWFHGPWRVIQPHYADVFGTPALVEKVVEHSEKH